jgi:hypothetical protein
MLFFIVLGGTKGTNSYCPRVAIYTLLPDNIPIEGFFSKLAFDEQIIGEERSWSAVELLNQYSMINIVKGVSNIHRLVQQVIRLQN